MNCFRCPQPTMRTLFGRDFWRNTFAIQHSKTCLNLRLNVTCRRRVHQLAMRLPRGSSVEQLHSLIILWVMWLNSVAILDRRNQQKINRTRHRLCNMVCTLRRHTETNITTRLVLV